MKIDLEDVSGLPEALQSLVSETDGKKELDLSQVAPASELEKFKSKALTAEQEAIERRQALKDWKALGESPEAVKEAMESAKKGGKGNEDHEKLVADLRKDYEAKLADKDKLISSTWQRQASADLKAELAKAGVVPEGLDLLAGYAQSRIQFNEDGTPKVLAPDGTQPMIGSGANGGATLADLAKEMAGSIPHLVADKGAGGGGKPPGSNGGTPGKKFSEMSSQELVNLRRDNPQEYDRLKAESQG